MGEAAAAAGAAVGEVAVAVGELPDAPPMSEWPQVGHPFPPVSALPDSSHDSARSAAEWWLNEYVSRPNIALQRDGAVCPCLPDRILAGRIRVTQVVLPDDKLLDRQVFMAKRLVTLGSIFAVDSRAEHSDYDALVVIPTDLALHEIRYVMDGAYTIVRKHFLRSKLMFGSFHPYSKRHSRLNRDFFSMRSEQPMFAMRHMIRSDGINLRMEPEYYRLYKLHFDIEES